MKYHWKTRLYHIWANMIQRTCNSKNTSYPNYGGRGITVCERWRKFSNFREDMGQSYKDGLTLERKDNSKGYYLSNCTWANWTTQMNNRRNSLVFTYKNQTKTLPQWSRLTGIKYACLYRRAIIKKWEFVRCIEEPTNSHIRKYTYKGKTLMLSEWAKEIGVKYATLYNRLVVEEWSVDRTLYNQTYKEF
jgi:hypothetical protein